MTHSYPNSLFKTVKGVQGTREGGSTQRWQGFWEQHLSLLIRPEVSGVTWA